MVDFSRNHALETWACDFLQAYDVFFRRVERRGLENHASGDEVLRFRVGTNEEPPEPDTAPSIAGRGTEDVSRAVRR